MTRFRWLSGLSLLLVIAATVFGVALQQARQFEGRGITVGFPSPVRGAEALRLGANVSFDVLDDPQRAAQAALLEQHGVRFIRQEFRWNDIERVRGNFDWSTSDRIFAQAKQSNLHVLAVLVTTPVWARQPSGSITTTETTPPQQAADFAHFAQAFTKRYDTPHADLAMMAADQSPLIGYQIWDEPNLSLGWGDNLIDPAGYLRLLWAAGDTIRAINPYARIVLAGLAPTVEMSEVNLAPHLFLRQLYRLGGHDAFDVAAVKPYGFDAPPEDRRVDAGVLNFSYILLLREEMLAHGEGDKAIWATEFGWNAVPPDWQGEPSIWGHVSEAAQAEWTGLAIQRAAREWPWLGGLFIDTLTPRPRETKPNADPAWGFALLTQAGQPRPVFAAFVAAQQSAQRAAQGQSAALCPLPTRLVKVIDNLNLQPQDKRAALDALPNIDIEDCYTPNPHATFTDGWRFGRMGADVPQHDGAKMTVRFSGDAFALTLRRAGIEYRAYAFVTIDGQPANLLPREPRGAYLVMNSSDLQPHVETIEVANGLGPGEHVAEIAIVGGWNLWALVGWSSRYEVGSGQWAIGSGLALFGGLIGLVSLVFALPRARWRVALVVLRSRIVLRLNAAYAMLAGLLMWLTASLTWAQDAATAWRNLPIAPTLVTGFTSALAFWSPLYVIGLIALIALFVFVLLRLDLGLMLLAFFIPFYLLPQRLFARSFSMVELLTLMCLVSWGIQKISAWRLTLRRPNSQCSILNAQFFKLPKLQFLPRLSLLDWSVLLLAIWSTISAFQAEFKVEAFRELRMVILESSAVYLMLRTYRPADASTDWRWRVLDGLIAGVTLVALIGLVNYVRGDRFVAEHSLPRIKSVFGSANNDALLLERVLPVLVAVCAYNLRRGAWSVERATRSTLHAPRPTPDTVRPTLHAVAILPIALALLLTQSRGALLFGLPAGLIVVCWLLGGRWRVLALVGLGLIVFGLGALLTGAALPLVQGTRLANVFDLQHGTGFVRINLWSSAWRMWRDHFWLGVGPDNFLYAYRSFYILPTAWQEPNLSHPHNIVFEFATRLGAPGLLAGLGLVAGTARQIWRGLKSNETLRPIYIGAAGMLAATLAHGVADQSFFLIELAFPFMVLVGLTSKKP